MLKTILNAAIFVAAMLVFAATPSWACDCPEDNPTSFQATVHKALNHKKRFPHSAPLIVVGAEVIEKLVIPLDPPRGALDRQPAMRILVRYTSLNVGGPDIINGKAVLVIGQDGLNCNAHLSDFQPGHHYHFILRAARTKDGYDSARYDLSDCGVNWEDLAPPGPIQNRPQP